MGMYEPDVQWCDLKNKIIDDCWNNLEDTDKNDDVECALETFFRGVNVKVDIKEHTIDFTNEDDLQDKVFRYDGDEWSILEDNYKPLDRKQLLKLKDSLDNDSSHKNVYRIASILSRYNLEAQLHVAGSFEFVDNEYRFCDETSIFDVDYDFLGTYLDDLLDTIIE